MADAVFTTKDEKLAIISKGALTSNAHLPMCVFAVSVNTMCYSVDHKFVTNDFIPHPARFIHP